MVLFTVEEILRDDLNRKYFCRTYPTKKSKTIVICQTLIGFYEIP